MRKYIWRRFMVAWAVILMTAGSAHALDLPCRAVKLVVPWGPGGGTAIIFELIAETINRAGIAPRVQVVTMPGQGGNKGAKAVRRAKPDGCTLLAIHQSVITSYLSGRAEFTWDAFEPVAMLTRTPAIVGARPSAGFDDLAALAEAANAAPETVLAGSTLGSSSHYFFLLLERAMGIRFKHVSYDGTRQRLTALLSETIDIGEINVTAAQNYIADGALNALAIATAERDPRVPEIPTLAEQGVDLEFGTERGVALPKGTPAEVIAFHESNFLAAMADIELKRQLEAKGNSIVALGSAAYRDHLGAAFALLEEAAAKAGATRQ